MDHEGLRRALLHRMLIGYRTRLVPAVPGRGFAGAANRVPRQEDVAGQARVSLRWYGHLERGDRVAFDPHRLARVADTLRVPHRERGLLHLLATGPDSTVFPRPVPRPAPDVSHDDRETLCRLSPNPAILTDHAWNVLAANDMVFACFPALHHRRAPAGPPNVLDWIFGDEAAATFADIDAVRRDAVTTAQLTYIRYGDDPTVAALVRTLLAHPGAATRWHRCVLPCSPRPRHHVRLRVFGTCEVVFLHHEDTDGRHLLAMLPAVESRPS
ncbi:MmyB family transcriptional regulator [Embleya sp. MST-111070]|uniref:MmyB family transcriptional regulator n=1 Tax=Embleya sp. MST-111070 TaxID=3398231 RepID=UPI003F737892